MSDENEMPLCYCGNAHKGECAMCEPVGSRYYGERVAYEKIVELEKELAQHKLAEATFHSERDALLARNLELEALLENPKDIESALLKRRTNKLNKLILEHEEMEHNYGITLKQHAATIAELEEWKEKYFSVFKKCARLETLAQNFIKVSERLYPMDEKTIDQFLRLFKEALE